MRATGRWCLGKREREESKAITLRNFSTGRWLLVCLARKGQQHQCDTGRQASAAKINTHTWWPVLWVSQTPPLVLPQRVLQDALGGEVECRGTPARSFAPIQGLEPVCDAICACLFTNLRESEICYQTRSAGPKPMSSLLPQSSPVPVLVVVEHAVRVVARVPVSVSEWLQRRMHH